MRPPHRYRDEDDDRDDYPPPRRGMSPAWIVIMVLGCGATLVLTALVIIRRLGF